MFPRTEVETNSSNRYTEFVTASILCIFLGDAELLEHMHYVATIRWWGRREIFDDEKPRNRPRPARPAMLAFLPALTDGLAGCHNCSHALGPLGRRCGEQLAQSCFHVPATLLSVCPSSPSSRDRPIANLHFFNRWLLPIMSGSQKGAAMRPDPELFYSDDPVSQS